MTDGTFDDLSRAMNYLYASWTKPVGFNSFEIEARIGVGAGIIDYPGFATVNY